MELEQEGKTRTAESNNRADHHPRKVIPYKEYAAHQAAKGMALTTSKPTLEDEENWMKNCHFPFTKLHQW